MVRRKRTIFLAKILYYLFLAAISLVWTYPLIWMFFSSMKPSMEIFATTKLLSSKLTLEPYFKGWKGIGGKGFGLFIANSFKLVLPTVAFTVISSLLVGYGFSRFVFPFRKLLFHLMLSTMMLPHFIVLIPRYLLFREFGWIDTYLPIIIPSMFAAYPFFTFMFIQFFRGIPRELDEAAMIDGCNSLEVLFYVLVPLCKPVIISAIVFQFIWTWNDFLNQLIYINSVSKYTVPLGLRMVLDVTSFVEWNQILAMSVVSILPCVLVFFVAQRYFVEGIVMSGLKG